MISALFALLKTKGCAKTVQLCAKAGLKHGQLSQQNALNEKIVNRGVQIWHQLLILLGSQKECANDGTVS